MSQQDPGPALQAAYVAVLAGLVVDGVHVPVYDSLAPNGAAAPYLILTRSETLPDDTKTSFGYRLTVTLEVVTRFGPGPISSAPAGAIVNALLALLFPALNAWPLAPAGFVLWSCRLSGVRPLNTETLAETLVRRLVTISHGLHPA